MKLFDTHAHLDNPRYDDDRDALMQRSRDAGVVCTLAMGTTAASSRKCIEIADRYPDVYAAVGIQPTYVGKPDAGDWDEIVELAKHPRVKAIGETGLDCYWDDNAPLPLQQTLFEQHIELSRQTGLPFIVHMRNSEAEVLQVLQDAGKQGPVNGIMHSFTGDWILAQKCLDLGMDISFAGMVTFKKSQDLRDVAAKIPADRILIETDSPYLTPHPFRSKRPNEPWYVQHTAECLAEARGVSVQQFADQTTQNACRRFAIALDA
ncbi:TatD family hydrolase [Rosistilla oblonga]|uniref:TatD family hydrolase n=1 Tax=Rosistilla oblonga TaxID=2527990 RepID=UPI003A98015D